MPWSHPDEPALRERHEQLQQRLAVHRADPNLTEQLRELTEAWSNYVEDAAQPVGEVLTIAFLAQVGRGKSTLISLAAGLRTKAHGGPQDWSILPVGDGRTTLGELRVHFEERTDVLLEVDPWPEDQLRQEIRAFAEDLWSETRSRSGAGPSDGAGEELYDLLRAWMAPEAPDRRAALRKLAEDAGDLVALHAALLRRVDLMARCQPLQRPFHPSAHEELQSTLRDLMDGELPGAPAPQVTHLRLPASADLPAVGTLVDTQGVELWNASLLIAGRSDLQRLLEDPGTLLVVCSEIEAVPDPVSLELLKQIAEQDRQRGSRGRTLRLLVVDRREKTWGDRAERALQNKLGQCRDRLRRADLSLADEHVVAIDARRQGGALRALLQGMVEEEQQRRIRRWSDALTSAEQAMEPLQEREHAARLRELDLRICWLVDAEVAKRPQRRVDPLVLLAETIRGRSQEIHHWSHIHAAVRRRGEYSKLDLSNLAARLAATDPIRGHVAVMWNPATLVASVGARDEREVAHVQLRVQRAMDVLRANFNESFVRWHPKIRARFQSSSSDTLWADCAARWGQGPGYVDAIADRLLAEAPRAALRLPTSVPAPDSSVLLPRPPLLRLHSAELHNYRGLTHQTVTFAQRSVLVGDNGLGKTAWLEAIAAALGVLLPGLGAGPEPAVGEDDVRQVVKEVGGLADRQLQLPMRVVLVGELQGRSLRWGRTIEAPPHEAALEETEAVRLLARTIAEELRAFSTRQLPLLCYYGTQRLWPVDLVADDRAEVGTRVDGYRDCLKAASTHRHMLTWMRKHTLIALQRRQPVVQFQAIERAVVRCVRGARSFRYDLATEALQLGMEDGTVVPFRLLSDGFRNVVGMVADLAWRASVLNPQLLDRAPDLVEGVVLIDEIDLHLHPRWQRHVLDDLQRAFPRLQIITTTHSPFIIQSLRQGELINLGPQANLPYENRSPEDIAEGVMGVDLPQRSERYQRMMEVAGRYYQLLDQVPAASDEQLQALRTQLDELEAPFSQDMAFTAALRHERMAAEQGLRG